MRNVSQIVMQAIKVLAHRPISKLAGKAARPRVRAYATLTLVRHIYLSSRTPERMPWTERLIQLCEQRLEAL